MAFERDLQILEALVSPEATRRGSLGVTRVAALTGIDKGQVSRALRALEAEGVVDRDVETLEYRLGWRLPTLVIPSPTGRIMRLVLDAIQGLAPRFPNTVTSFAILQGVNIYLPYSVSAGGALQNTGWKNQAFPAFATAAGRVLLSDLTRTELHKLYQHGLDSAQAPHSPTKSLEDLAKRVDQARAEGFSMSDGEFQPRVAGGAAPIRDYSGLIVGALNVSGIALSGSHSERHHALREAGQEIAQACGKISTELGWTRFPVG